MTGKLKAIGIPEAQPTTLMVSISRSKFFNSSLKLKKNSYGVVFYFLLHSVLVQRSTSQVKRWLKQEIEHENTVDVGYTRGLMKPSFFIVAPFHIKHRKCLYIELASRMY